MKRLAVIVALVLATVWGCNSDGLLCGEERAVCQAHR